MKLVRISTTPLFQVFTKFLILVLPCHPRSGVRLTNQLFSVLCTVAKKKKKTINVSSRWKQRFRFTQKTLHARPCFFFVSSRRSRHPWSTCRKLMTPRNSFSILIGISETLKKKKPIWRLIPGHYSLFRSSKKLISSSVRLRTNFCFRFICTNQIRRLRHWKKDETQTFGLFYSWGNVIGKIGR